MRPQAQCVACMRREAPDGGNEYLIPVRLDDYVITDWNPPHADLAQSVGDRVMADFRSHDDDAAFHEELAKLVSVPKKRPVNAPVYF
jgi:hypothetical protein